MKKTEKSTLTLHLLEEKFGKRRERRCQEQNRRGKSPSGKTDHTVWCLTQEWTVPKIPPECTQFKTKTGCQWSDKRAFVHAGKTSDDKILNQEKVPSHSGQKLEYCDLVEMAMDRRQRHVRF